MTCRRVPTLSRRTFCATGAAALFSAGLTRTPSFAAEDGRPLWQSAKERNILFGASLAVHELDTAHGPAYAALYERDTRILTSELEFKLSSLRANADRYDFAAADRLAAFAKERGLALRGHTLIWQDDLPEWAKQLDKSAAQTFLSSHIEAVAGRYGDAVKYWDVVNEPIAPWDHLPGNLRNGPFYAALGEDYIVKAFEAAHAVAPRATLVLNEAQTETADDQGETFRTSLLGLVKRLKYKGAPIDAIGLQSHLKLAAKYDLPRFVAFLEEIAAFGYDIHITELDVNDTGLEGSAAKRDEAVAAMYERYLTAVLKVSAVRVVQTWQLADATSWMQDAPTQRRMHIRKDPRPLLYDTSFARKPAWHAVERAFLAAPER